MSNLMLLPQFSALVFSITTNGGWYDVITFLNEDQVAIDLTGITFASDVKDATTNPDNVLNLSTTNGLLVNGNAAGTLSFNVPAASLSALTPGAYVIDILATETSSGKIRNLFELGPGTVNIIEGVTR